MAEALWLAPARVLQPARVLREAAPKPATPATSLSAASFEQIPIHVAAVNFLVAHGAVLKHRRTQIVKCGRHYARNFRRHSGENRVTLQAYKTDIGACQHPGIR